MRKFLAACIAILALTFSMISSVAAQLVGPNIFNVANEGAVTTYGVDNTAAYQSAVNKAIAWSKATGNFSTAIVFVPPGAYYLGRTVMIDGPNVEIRGVGHASETRSISQTANPHFLFGVPRAPVVGGQTLLADTSVRPDLFGLLDASAAPVVGKRWGFRDAGSSLLYSTNSTLSHGARRTGGYFAVDAWTQCRALTIDFAVQGPGGGPIAQSTLIAGIGNGNNQKVFPYWIYTDGTDHYTCLIGTQPAAFGPLTIRRVTFAAGTKQGPRRITVQVNLDAATFAAWVDGVQVEAKGPMGADFVPGWLGRFAENEFFPWIVGDKGGTHPSMGVNGGQFDLLGFAVSRSPRYAVGAVGSPQARADGKPLTDLYRYFTPPAEDSGLISSLAFTDNPVNNPRQLTVNGGPASDNVQTSAWLFQAGQLTGGLTNQGVRNLQMTGGKTYGQTLALGQVLNFRATGIRTSASAVGIGTFGCGAAYVLDLSDLDIDASDSAISTQDAGVWLRQVRAQNSGRATFRFQGSNVAMQDANVAFWNPWNQSTVKVHGGTYGGNYTVRNLTVDYEGGSYLQAPFWAESQYYGQTSLRLEDISLGTVGGPTIPIVMLRDPYKQRASTLSVSNLSGQGKGAAVDVDGGLWKGTVIASPTMGTTVAAPAGTTPGVIMTMPGTGLTPVPPVVTPTSP